MAKENNATHWVLGGALLLIGLFVIIALIMIRSQAQDITVSVDNAAPTIDGGTAKLCPGDTTTANLGSCTNITSLSLTAGGTTNVTYTVQVTDTNGLGDLNDTATGVLYQDVASGGASCTGDNNDCYRADGTCHQSLDVDSDTEWFRCDYTIGYYANETVTSGNWVGGITVEDAAATTDSDNTYTFEMAKLVAGDFPTIDFGSVALGFTSTAGSNEDVTHNNNGNVTLDINTRLDDGDANAQVDCSTGGIPDDNFTFDNDNLSGDVDFGTASKTLTVASPAGVDMEIDIVARTNDGSAQGPNNPRVAGDDVAYSYWNIDVPTTGILGSCSEELIVNFIEA